VHDLTGEMRGGAGEPNGERNTKIDTPGHSASGRMVVCAQGWFSTSGKFTGLNIDCVIVEAFYFILESVLCALHVWQMIPKDSKQSATGSGPHNSLAAPSHVAWSISDARTTFSYNGR
jgi:hypothetical protein